MRISVVTAAYNAEATIEDTLRSVAEQTHPDVEHIVVDGNSRDRTAEIVRAYPQVRLISEPDRGLYDAMNKGWRAATGDVVGWLNADDMFASPKALATIAAAKAPDIDIVAASIEMVDADDLTKVRRRYTAARFEPSWLRFGHAPPHPGFYISLAAMRRVGDYDLRYRLAADFDLMARAIHTDRLRYVALPDVVVKMRLGGVSDGIRAKVNGFEEVLSSCRELGIRTSRPRMALKFLRKATQYFG